MRLRLTVRSTCWNVATGADVAAVTVSFPAAAFQAPVKPAPAMVAGSVSNDSTSFPES